MTVLSGLFVCTQFCTVFWKQLEISLIILVSQKLFERKLVAHFCLIIQVKGFSVKDLMLNTGGKFI